MEVQAGYQETDAPVGASVPYLPESAKETGGKFVVGDTSYEAYQKEGVTLYRVEKA